MRALSAVSTKRLLPSSLSFTAVAASSGESVDELKSVINVPIYRPQAGSWVTDGSLSAEDPDPTTYSLDIFDCPNLKSGTHAVIVTSIGMLT